MIQLLEDMGLSKYLGNNLNRISIMEDAEHEAHSPVQLKGKKQAANSLVNDARIHERSKHIDVAYHHFRDLSKRNLIQLDYVPSTYIVADGLTKPLMVAADLGTRCVYKTKDKEGKQEGKATHSFIILNFLTKSIDKTH